MKPGTYILDLLLKGQDTGKTIVYLRHSTRNSFAGVPEHLRQGVEITEEGIQVAREFGTSLHRIFPEKRLILGHTVARRCQMTAEFIGQGFSPAGFQIIDYQKEIEDPILDMESYCAERDENGWENLIINWLNKKVPQNIMQDPDTYADRHVKKLISFDSIDNGNLFVVIGHDYTIFPIVSRVFGKRMTGIDFLNGIVIQAGSGTAKILFSDADGAMKKELHY